MTAHAPGGDRSTDVGGQREEPDLDDPAWAAFGKTLGTPAAATSSVTDKGRSRTPVATADSPSGTARTGQLAGPVDSVTKGI